MSTTSTHGATGATVPSPQRTVGIAMIGSGMMAKSHTMAFRNLRAVHGTLPVEPRLVVLCDTTPELAGAGAGSLGYERWTTDWRTVLADPEVDIVDIVTPNYLHKDMSLAAAAAGKHIYCEKPLALTAEDALEMTEAAERANVTTMVGFSYVHNPAVALARKLLLDGRLGEVTTFTGAFAINAMTDPQVPFSWRQDRALAGSGALGDLGAHVIALARALVGDITRVSSLASTVVKERPETHGAFGYGEAAGADLPVRAGGNGHGHYGALWPIAGINIGVHDLKLFEAYDFVSAIAEGRRAWPDFREGYEVERVIDAIDLASRERQWVDVR